MNFNAGIENDSENRTLSDVMKKKRVQKLLRKELEDIKEAFRSLRIIAKKAKRQMLK
ncbi:MAG: hypothetical protein R3B39_01245 [Candidatus Paceibacterota bacterium]